MRLFSLSVVCTLVSTFMMWMSVHGVPSAYAQFADSKSPVSFELRGLQIRASRAFSLREWPQVVQFFQQHQDEWNRFKEARRTAALQKTDGTLENPAIQSEAQLLKELSQVEGACPSEILAVTKGDEPIKKAQKEFVLPAQASFEGWASCLRGYEVVYSRFTHWNDLRLLYVGRGKRADDRQRDIRSLLQLLSSANEMTEASLDRVQLNVACLELKTWMKNVEFKIDCDSNFSISDLRSEYERSRRVVKKNSIIRVIQEGAKTVLELPVRTPEPTAQWLQEVLDRTWNQSPALQIRIVKGEKGSALRILEAVGITPAANGIAGDEIVMDPRGEASVNELIMAHELGHVLGFLDGYTEIWQSEDRSTLYYEVEPGNIMSSLAGAVLPMHVEALMEAYTAGLNPSQK